MSVGESFERNFIGGGNEYDAARENDLTRNGRQVLFDALAAFKLNTVTKRNKLAEKVKTGRERQLGEKALDSSKKPKHRSIRDLPREPQRTREDERGAAWSPAGRPGVDLTRHNEPTAEEKTQRLIEQTLGLNNADRTRLPMPTESPTRGRGKGDEFGRTRDHVRQREERLARERLHDGREHKR
jgi:hypothetical protein